TVASLCRLHLRHSGHDSGGTDYGIHHRLDADCGVDHQVVELAVVPLQSEIPADVCGAISVNMLHLFQCGLGTDMSTCVFQLLLATPINKEVECIDSAGEDACCAASYDYTIAAIGCRLNHLANMRHHLLTIKTLWSWLQCSFRSTLPECLRQTVIPGITSLIVAFDQRGFDVTFLRHLLQKCVIHQFPSQSLGQPVRDLYACTAVFTLYCDYPNHGPPLLPLVDPQPY